MFYTYVKLIPTTTCRMDFMIVVYHVKLTSTSTTKWAWELSDLRNASLPFIVGDYAMPDGNANIGSTFQKKLNTALNNFSIKGGNQNEVEEDLVYLSMGKVRI